MRSDVVFARKAYAAMLDWKNNLADKYALLVEGARRVGKMPSSGLFRSLRVFRT